MARKLGVKKATKNEVVLKDGTKMTMRDGKDLLELYHQAVFDLFMSQKTDTKNPIAPFIQSAFENTLDANKYQTLEHIIKDTAEYFSQNNADRDYIEFLLSKELFSWQKDLLVDKSKKITLLCGRRSGKSFGEAAVAVNHCIDGFDKINGFKKARKVAIIGLTVQKCVDVFWQNVLNFAKTSKMKFKANNSENVVRFANGATITLFGNNSKAEREKIRGEEYSLIIIDEAQSQHSLEYLLTDILEPIIVGRDSTVILSGTGSLTGFGKWADITTGEECQQWKHYTATMRENPTIPDAEIALEKVLQEHGWTIENITFQREYLAKNVIDKSRIVFPNVHYYKDVPKDFIATGCYVGVDYGWEDFNAFATIVWDNAGKIYLVKEERFNHASVTEIVNKAKEIREFISKTFKVEAVFVADNSDQSISREIYNCGVKIQNAYKVDVFMQISRLKEYLENGTLSIREKGFSDWESKQTVWKWDDEKKCVIYEIDDDYFHPDILHALRYAVNTYRSKFKK